MLELPNSVEANSTSDDKVTWSLRGAYTLNSNVNLFATAATGFKASSWNLSRDSRPFPTDQAAIESAGLRQPNQSYGTRFASPEEATVYELGIKSNFDSVSFNATIFDQTIEGFQSSTFVGTGFVLANGSMRPATPLAERSRSCPWRLAMLLKYESCRFWPCSPKGTPAAAPSVPDCADRAAVRALTPAVFSAAEPAMVDRRISASMNSELLALPPRAAAASWVSRMLVAVRR
nr:TonB-dependent receptor [uncultured Paraglaciecola sp.]